MDSKPYSFTNPQRRAHSVSQAGAVCPLRMGITQACGLVGKKTAVGYRFPLDWLSSKQDTSVHEKEEQKPERTGAWQSRREGAGREIVRRQNYRDCQQGRECKSRTAITGGTQPDSEVSRSSP